MPVNEYEELLTTGQAPNAGGNEYVNLINEDAGAQKEALQQSMFVASKAQPDQRAKVMELSEKMNLPPNIVERNFEDVQKKAEVASNDYEKLIRDTPGLAKWLEDPDNASLAKDDLDALGGVEKSLKEYSTMESLLSAINSGVASLGASAARVPSLAYDTAAILPNIAADHTDLLDKTSSKQFTSEYNPFNPNNALAQYFDRKAQDYKTPDMDKNIVDEINAGNYGGAGRAMLAQIAANSPQQLAIIAATLTGAGIPALIGAGVTTAAQSNAEAQQEGNVNPEIATINALTHGTIESAFERLGTFGVLKQWEGVIAKQYGKQVSREVMKDFGKTLAYSVAAEGNEEAMTSIGQDFSDYITGVNPNALEGIANRAGNAAIVGGASGGLITSPSAVGSAAVRHGYAKRAELAKNFYLSMGKAAEATKLRERLPRAQKQFVESLTKDTPVENIFIPLEAAESYFQSANVNPVAAMQEFGVLQAYEEAKQTGGDIKVPLATWADKVVGTEHYAALQNDVKFSPNDLTVNEAKEAREQAAQAQREAEAESQPQAEPQNTAQAQAESIRAKVSEQLQAAGIDTKAAETYSKLYESAFKTLGERAGINPLDLFSRYGLQVRKEGQPVDGSAPLSFDQEVAAMNPANADEATRDIQVQSFEQSQKEPAPAFYSKLQRTIEQKMGGAQDVTSLKAMLRDIKPEEMKWSGLDEFLKGKTKVSKQEVLDHLRGNALEIQEVTKRGEEQPEYDVNVYGEDGAYYNAVSEVDSDMGETIINNGPFETEEEAEADAHSELDRRGLTGEKSGAPKFSQYTLPGGENYREVLFTLPAKNDLSIELSRIDEEWAEIMDRYDIGDKLSDEDSARLKEIGERRRKAENSAPPQFDSTHFDEANVLAHTRLNDRIDADGKKVLFVEEIQSDWHQAGRKKGYRDSSESLPPDYELIVNPKSRTGVYQVVRKADGEVVSMGDTEEFALESFREDFKGDRVPDAPFRKTWHEFVLKRLIREAAEKGYDKIAWTTGEQQADRYDLSKQIDSVELAKDNETGNITLYAYDKNGSGDPVIEEVLSDESQVEEHIGKEAAQKLSEAKWGRKNKNGFQHKKLSNADLKVGGEGMKGFYDKILVDAANKLGKKFGAKVGETQLAGDPKKPRYYIEDSGDGIGFNVVDSKDTESFKYYIEEDDAMAARQRLNESSASSNPTLVHSLDITDQFKNMALNEGFSLFQPGQDGDPRGRINISPNRLFNIELLKDADASTFLHETGHFYLEVIGDLAQAPDAPKQIKDDYAAILKWLGVETRDQIKKDQHEQWARGFEAYLMEGKAPSNALRQAFARFKVWLISLYRNMTSLNVTLTPEVRGVMNRMLATESEIQEAQKEFKPLFPDPRTVGMTEDQSYRYLNAKFDAEEAAKAELNEKLMRDFNREKESWWKEQSDKLRTEIEAEVNQMPVYDALALLQKGKRADGSPAPEGAQNIKLSKEALVQELGKEILNQLPRPYVYSAKGGIHHDMVADILGFRSGADLVNQMAQAENKEALIERRVDEQMRERYPDLLTDGTLPDESIKAIHNEKRADLLRLELEHLASNNLPALKDVIRRVARRPPSKAQVRAQAQEILGSKTVRDLRPDVFRRGEVKAANQAADLLAKGDIDGAFLAKQRELLNHELYREAVKAQDLVEKSLVKFKKIVRATDDAAKTRDMDLVNAAKAVLASFGLGRSDEAPQVYLEKMKHYDPDTYFTVKALVDSATERTAPYKELTFDEFQSMNEAVSAIWDLSRSTRQIEIDGQKLDRDQVKAELQSRIEELTRAENKDGYTREASNWDKTKVGLMGMRAALRRTESWVSAMDAGDSKGVFRKYIWNPISEATNQYRDEKKKYLQKFLDIVKPIEETLVRQEIRSPELGHAFDSKAQVLGALLHTGNESNLRKLLLGRGWGDLDSDGNLDTSRWDRFVSRLQQDGTLTKADYDFMQSVWDLHEEIKPGAQRAHKAMYGHYFNEITATEIQTPFGTYRGGYVPAVADPMKTSDAAIRSEQEELTKSNNSFMFPTSGRGFTKSRVETYNAPLAIDLRLIPGHLDKVLRFTHIEPKVKDVGRIVMDRGFRKVLDGLDPSVGSDMLVPWLQRSAQQKVSLSSKGWGGKAMDSFFRELRTRTGLQIMAANFTNTLQQFTGLSIAALKVKPKYLRSALWDYMSDRKGTADSVSEKSSFMRNRVTTQVFEIQSTIDDLLLNPTKYEKAREFAKKHGYFLQAGTQNIVDIVVWSGAYNESIERGETELGAVRIADSAVRETQGSFAAEDISRFETGTPLVRMFTMFYSYFNMQANILGSEFATVMRTMGLRKGLGRLAYVYTMGFMIPAFLNELIVRTMSGDGLDADDDDQYLDDLMAMFFGSQFRTATAFFPVVGPSINAGVNAFNDKWYDDRISTSPAISAIESTVSAPKSLYEGLADDATTGEKKKAVRDTLTALGLLSGIPLAPLAKPASYIIDLREGNANPSGPIDALRGLASGKPGKE